MKTRSVDIDEMQDMKAKRRPRFASEMTTEELERLTADLDEEFVIDKSRPLTPEEREVWQQIKRKGRPKKGNGAKVISVSIERGLLTRSDHLAKKLGITRAALIARGLEMVAAAAKRR